ncbi:serpin B4-like [Spodoptera litura]|uniref:Serpin B4-like n=1 Tax=Spodoptera litura TaxID=69820 RepID=A0A9J7EW13_SPOLT|nr:serpin B4-like [Spodoptera litura]
MLRAKMEVKLLTFVILCAYGVLASEYNCGKRSALLLLKRPAYEFSMRMLQRVTEETDAHFVYSPVSTWLQLSALAEGADGRTLNEIWRLTRHHKNRCFKRQLSGILNRLNFDLRFEMKRKSVIAIDKLMAVNKKYIQDIAKLYGIKVLLLAFNEPEKSAQEVNHVIEDGTDGVINRILYHDDFNDTVLLMSDASYFRSDWKSPFTSVGVQPFYSRKGDKIGEVSMINQVGQFNVIDFPHIGATVLEIPCASRRISMLVFLPLKKLWVSDIFYSLQTTRLTSIFNMYNIQGPQLVNVTIPRFKQRSEVENLPELVYDMGIRRIFDPNAAEFKGISKFRLYASLMTQITDIEVNEKGVTATANSLVRNNGSAVEFLANKPFAYVIVDKVTDFILYAGMYSSPSVI